MKHEKKKKYRDDGGCVLDSELAAAQLPMPSSSDHVRDDVMMTKTIKTTRRT